MTFSSAVLRIRITLMRIRILLFVTLMRMRILIVILMRIRILRFTSANFQKKAQNLEKEVLKFHIFWLVICKLMRIRIQLVTLMRIQLITLITVLFLTRTLIINPEQTDQSINEAKKRNDVGSVYI
jgi:hypothetical protein